MWCGFDWNIFQIITEIFTQFVQLCFVINVVDGAKFVVTIFPCFFKRDYIELFVLFEFLTRQALWRIVLIIDIMH